MPAEPLRPYISHYVGFRGQGLEPIVHSAPPARHLCLAISLSDPIHVVKAPGSPIPSFHRAFIIGFSTEPATVKYQDHRDGLFIHFKPNGIFALFAVKAFELSSRLVDLSLIWGASDDVMDQLVTALTWQERFAIVDQLFLKVLKPVHTAPELAWAWAQLVGSGGSIPVHQLAADAGWSRQHFGKRFIHQFGISPKTAGRIFRFENAIRLLKSGCTELAQVAAECGFYDQAHLTLEWNAMAGCSPGAWIARELPFFQYTRPFDQDD
jgi:AraC-like DNA-binding protein